MPHPIQDMFVDEDCEGHRYPRFHENKIVSLLLDKAPIGLNELACMEFSQEDREQFAQLIGYSLGGFSELSYVSDKTYNRANRQAKKMMEQDQKVAAPPTPQEPHYDRQASREAS